MKCEQVKELFPELVEHKDKYPDATAHLEACSECKTLFHIFESISDDAKVTLAPEKREMNFEIIHKKMKRHDRVVFTRRISSLVAVMLFALVSIFNVNSSRQVTVADISDEVLYLQSESISVPKTSLDDEAIIAYLTQYENIENIGGLF